MRSCNSVIVFILAVVILLCHETSTANESLSGDGTAIEAISLNEDMLRSLIIAYRDFQAFLAEESNNAERLDRSVSSSMKQLLNPNSYAVDMRDEGKCFVIKFDPKRIRQQVPISGGSVKYVINKKDFTFERVLVK